MQRWRGLCDGRDVYVCSQLENNILVHLQQAVTQQYRRTRLEDGSERATFCGRLLNHFIHSSHQSAQPSPSPAVCAARLPNRSTTTTAWLLLCAQWWLCARRQRWWRSWFAPTPAPPSFGHHHLRALPLPFSRYAEIHQKWCAWHRLPSCSLYPRKIVDTLMVLVFVGECGVLGGSAKGFGVQGLVAFLKCRRARTRSTLLTVAALKVQCEPPTTCFGVSCNGKPPTFCCRGSATRVCLLLSSRYARRSLSAFPACTVV